MTLSNFCKSRAEGLTQSLSPFLSTFFLSSVPSPKVCASQDLLGESLGLRGRGGQVSSGLPHLKGQSCDKVTKCSLSM